MLTNAKIRAAKPQDKAYKLTESHRLYLLVKPSGSKPLCKGCQPAITDLVLLRAMIVAAEEDYARPIRLNDVWVSLKALVQEDWRNGTQARTNCRPPAGPRPKNHRLFSLVVLIAHCSDRRL